MTSFRGERFTTVPRLLADHAIETALFPRVQREQHRFSEVVRRGAGSDPVHETDGSLQPADGPLHTRGARRQRRRNMTGVVQLMCGSFTPPQIFRADPDIEAITA